MKKYRVALIDFSKPQHPIFYPMQYTDGLKAARAVYPEIKAHFSNNARCFIGWSGTKNLIITQI